MWNQCVDTFKNFINRLTDRKKESDNVDSKKCEVICPIQSENEKLKKEKNEKDIFDKYAVHYIDDSISEEDRKRYVDRQLYMYKGLCDKGLESTNVEKLLDVALQELHSQENLKQILGNKVGFAIAFWGILLTVFVDKELLNNLIDVVLNIKNKTFLGVVAIILITISIFLFIKILVDVFKILSPKNWEELDLNDIDSETFKAAVDDKYISLVVLVETSIYALAQNKRTNERKANLFKELIIEIVVFALVLIISSLFY